jgi:exosortase A-associated hydrolase 1
MKFIESVSLFGCAGDTLLGILARPEIPADTGVVLIVGGPQYRVGSHRQFLLLSRALASAGIAVLRFDYRGMGDSTGQRRDFESVSADIAAAIGELQAQISGVRHIVLWGLCDGASAALLYCHETGDPRVTGLCLLNPWVRSEVSLAQTHLKHYYTRRLKEKEFWVKLLNGKVALGALSGLLRNVQLAITGLNKATANDEPFQTRMAHAWQAFKGSILLILSGDDYTAKEFLEYSGKNSAWNNLLTAPRVLRHDVAGANHTFSDPHSRGVVENLALAWLTNRAEIRRVESG